MRRKKLASLRPALQALPRHILELVAQQLDHNGKLNLLATSRELAEVVMLCDPDQVITCKPSRHTRWHGLAQVLTWAPRVHLELCCDDVAVKHNTMLNPISRFLVSTASQCTAVNDRFPGVERVNIRAFKLPCLVPPLIATTCPNMKTISLRMPSAPSGDEPVSMFRLDRFIQPQPVCTSLKEIRLHNFSTLPLLYHSVDDLKAKIPGIQSLVFVKTPYHTSMITAWGSQLTSVTSCKLPVTPNNNLLVQCTKLQTLTMNHSVDASRLLMCPEPALVLTKLCVPAQVLSELQLQQVLFLTALTSLTVNNFKSLEHDYSQYPCQWKHVCLMLYPDDEEGDEESYLDFANLSKLPLTMVTDFVINNSELIMQLPDPSEPNSLTAVLRATDVLRNAGRIRFHEEVSDGVVEWVGCDGDDCWDAQLMIVAAPRIPSNKSISIADNGSIHDLPALVAWGKETVEEVTLPLKDAMEAAVLQSLHLLQQLRSLIVLVPAATADDAPDNDHELMQLCSLTCMVAEHLVVPTRRAVTLKACLGMPKGVIFDSESAHPLARATQLLCHDLNVTLPEGAVVRDIMMHRYNVLGRAAVGGSWQLSLCPRGTYEVGNAAAITRDALAIVAIGSQSNLVSLTRPPVFIR